MAPRAHGTSGAAQDGATLPLIADDVSVQSSTSVRSASVSGISMRELRFSTTMALVMAILGSSVLPVSYAFAKTGIFMGALVSLLVALCNTYTCRLLLRAALRTQTSTFEELCCCVGGPAFQAFAQAANVVLLLGNLTGDMCLLADLGSRSLLATMGAAAPAALVAHHGRGIMLLLTVLVILPLSLPRGMRALEYVSSAGVPVLLVLCIVLTADAASNGFAGVGPGAVPLWTLNLDSPRHLAEAFALIGFSFYVHPMMMPLLAELPSGRTGVAVLEAATTTVIMGVALSTYSYIGAVGAAAFGDKTEGDIMMNDLISSRGAAAALAIVVLVYLSSCMPPIVMSLRCYIDFALSGPRAEFRPARFVSETVLIILAPLALAWHDPSLSERAFALTGATGVCIVCYVIPVVAHLALALRKGGPLDAVDTDDPLAAPALVDDAPLIRYMSTSFMSSDSETTTLMRLWTRLWGSRRRACTTVRICFTPLLVLAVGCGFSGIALYGAIREIVRPH